MKRPPRSSYPSAPQPRQPKGIPVGGQYASMVHAESDLVLEDVSSLDADLRAERHNQLLNAGYVPAISTRTGRDNPAERAKREEWWEQHWVTAEYRPEDRGQYPQMPDDYTPNYTSGRARSNRRRTHRMRYTGAGVDMRMASVASIRRFEKEHGGTFDVPISASYPGGDIQGWVRVTRMGDRWHTTGLGFPPEANAYVSEAVSSVLEARRPAGELGRIGDLIERRRAREQAAGVDLQPVNSSWVEQVGYDDATGTIILETRDRRTYGHHVGRDIFGKVAGSRSPGAAYNKLVRGSPRSEVTRCEACGRFSAGEHVCPGQHLAPRTDLTGLQNAANRESAIKLTATAAGSSQPPAPPAPLPPAHSFDLKSMLMQQGRQPLRYFGDKALYGARGWTTDVADSVGRFTDSRHVPWAFEDGKRVETGIVFYDRADAAVAETLLHEMPLKARAENQNGGPRLGNVLEATRSDNRLRFGGYLVGPDRTDERVGISTIWVDARDETEARSRLAAIDPDAREPDGFDLVATPDTPGQHAWRAWWT